MSDGKASHRQLWQAPLTVWAVLIVLLGLNYGLAQARLGGIALNLGGGAVMVCLLAAMLMGLNRASALIRLFAVGGLFWVIIMFALTLSDYLSRTF